MLLPASELCPLGAMRCTATVLLLAAALAVGHADSTCTRNVYTLPTAQSGIHPTIATAADVTGACSTRGEIKMNGSTGKLMYCDTTWQSLGSAQEGVLKVPGTNLGVNAPQGTCEGAGDLKYDTQLKQVVFCDGSNWQTLSSGGARNVPKPQFWEQDLGADVRATPGTGQNLDVMPFVLDHDSHVVVTFDVSLSDGGANSWAAICISVDGSQKVCSHVQPDQAGEDDTLHMVWSENLSAGAHEVKVYFSGTGSLQPFSRPHTDYGGAHIWGRATHILAIPNEWIEDSGRAVGVSSASKADCGVTCFATIPDMEVTLTLSEPSVVVVLFAAPFYGPWSAQRLVIAQDGDTPDADQQYTHVDTSADGSEWTVRLHRIATLPAGTHKVYVEWGQGSGTFYQEVLADRANRVLTAFAVPVSMGASGVYANPVIDANSRECFTATRGHGFRDMERSTVTAVAPNTYTYQGVTGRADSVIAMSFGDMNYLPINNDAAWKAMRIQLDDDNVCDRGVYHSQPYGTGAEDHVSVTRMDELTPGTTHKWDFQWGQPRDGIGTVCIGAASGENPYFTKRIGVLLLPVPA